MSFLGHNFSSRHARRSSKGSIDVGDHLVFKKKQSLQRNSTKMLQKNEKNYFFILRFWMRHKVHIIQTHTVCTMQIEKKTDTKERFIATLEVEQQGYRHFLNTTVCLPITSGKTSRVGHQVIKCGCSSNNKDEYKQSDCIKAHKHTLLNFLHRSRTRHKFFSVMLMEVMDGCYGSQ